MHTQPLAQLMRHGQGHRPDRGQFGACKVCQFGCTSGERCFYPFTQADGSSGTSTTLRRSKDGICGDGHLHELRVNPNKHPNQKQLALH